MPATVPPAGPVIDDEQSAHRDRLPWWRSRWIWGAGAAVGLVAGMLLWLGSGGDPGRHEKDDVPLIRAAEAPVKVRPEDPGGMDVAHRDKLIYQRFEGEDGTPLVERLLSAPEEPLPPPRPDLETASPPSPATADESATREPVPAPAEETMTGFVPVPAEETILDQPFEQFPESTAPEAPSAVDAPSSTTEPSVAMAPPRPRPSAPAAAPSGLSAEARMAQSLLAGTQADDYAIQLGSVRSRQEANVEWERLKRNHGDVLGDLALTVLEADLGQRGTYYRLRAGPISSQASARQLCNSLVDRKVACIVVQP